MNRIFVINKTPLQLSKTYSSNQVSAHPVKAWFKKKSKLLAFARVLQGWGQKSSQSSFILMCIEALWGEETGTSCLCEAQRLTELQRVHNEPLFMLAILSLYGLPTAERSANSSTIHTEKALNTCDRYTPTSATRDKGVCMSQDEGQIQCISACTRFKWKEFVL